MARKFGYETKGSSSWNIGKFFASRFVCPDPGVLSSISVYLFNDSGSTQKIQLGIYKDVSGTIGKRLISTISVSIPAAFDNWRTIILPAFLELGSVYWLTVQLENSAAIVYIYYDAGDQEQHAYKEDWDFGTWPDNPEGLTYSANKISIYATYTPVPTSPYTWGFISKNQIDPERVESAIARIVGEHNDNEQAHIGEGRSLDQHKLSDVIDHVVASIIADKIADGEVIVSKLNWDKFLITAEFESLDGWEQGGVGTETITCVLGGTKLKTGVVDGDTAYIRCRPSIGFGINPNFDKKPLFQLRLKLMDKGFAETHIHVGSAWFQAAAADYIGFRFDQDKIYAVCRQSVSGETATDITGTIDSESFHDYKVVYYSTSKVEFYIDGDLKTIITTNIPWGNNEEAMMFIGVKNSHDGGDQSIGVQRAIYYQDI